MADGSRTELIAAVVLEHEGGDYLLESVLEHVVHMHRTVLLEGKGVLREHQVGMLTDELS